MTVQWTVIDKKRAKLSLDSQVLALPIFPGSHPPSIVGANELNFCVRDGNRWTLIAINTNYLVLRGFVSLDSLILSQTILFVNNYF